MLANPQPYLCTLDDPRRATRNKLHALQDIIMITLCSTWCGYDDWVSIEDLALENQAWLRQFLALENGIPSHDTLSDVMGRLDRQAFAEAFSHWMQDSPPTLGPSHIALDGKTLRGSRQAGSAIHLMSAFATQARLVLAQHQVPGKTNEITALPQLMKQVDLCGSVIARRARLNRSSMPRPTMCWPSRTTIRGCSETSGSGSMSRPGDCRFWIRWTKAMVAWRYAATA